MTPHEAPRLLAVASGGGHWVELLRLTPAFEGWDISYVSTFDGHGEGLPSGRYHVVPDATRRDMRVLLRVAWRAWRIVRTVRPQVVVTTGSAPGLAFVIVGRLFGARTLWIDSIAQPTELSGSGRIAKLVSDRVVAQWPDAAAQDGIDYWGAVL